MQGCLDGAWICIQGRSLHSSPQASDAQCPLQAFKEQHALDHSANELAQELKETLAYAKECRNLKAIPEATDVLLEIAKLVVQSAAAFDAHMRYSLTSEFLCLMLLCLTHPRSLGRALMSAVTKSSQKRISECEQRLKVLRKKLQENLVIRIFQGQNELLTDSMLRFSSVLVVLLIALLQTA